MLNVRFFAALLTLFQLSAFDFDLLPPLCLMSRRDPNGFLGGPGGPGAGQNIADGIG